jgi:hypothetical protein
MAAVLGCHHVTIPCAAKMPRVPTGYHHPPPIPRSSNAIAVVGDLQGLLFAERLIGRSDNGEETAELVCQMGQERVGATVLLGDLVTFGSSVDAWERFDESANRLSGVLLPVRGNHDLMGNEADSDHAWVSRFPWFDRQPWYAVKWNQLGLVFLDSNLEKLEPIAQVAEQFWYQRVLDHFEWDPSVRGVVVFLHHAPFTANPNTQSGLRSLREAFVEPFCAHEKTLAMISGHAHDYERYDTKCGKRRVEFIVSGGGGGPAPKWVRPYYDDACLAAGRCEPDGRPMHYLVLKQQDWGISIFAHALSPGSEANVFDWSHLPYVQGYPRNLRDLRLD